MSDFVAGFAIRHAVAQPLLAQALAPRDTTPHAFAAVDPALRVREGGPKHFHPAAPGHKPTAGWDLLEPAIDPVAAARAEGFAEGHAAAIAAAEATHGRDQALLAELAGALTHSFDREALAERLRRTVLMLVEKLVGEAGIAPDLIATRIEAACDLLAEPSESALLRVHPDDVALLDGRLPSSVFAAGDPHVARGSFVLESASTIVEDGPALWLQQLGAAIDRVPVPSC